MIVNVNVADDIAQLLEELAVSRQLGAGHVIVVGASTSEVMGEHIGTAGAEDVAAQLFEGLNKVRTAHGFDLAFQCCEHLNRALVVERKVQERDKLTEVSAIPVPTAGGAMAAHAFRHMIGACLVEYIQADAGIDIGDTLIGMHLRPVAVPYRSTVKRIGQAHVTSAYTRPKLIGGARAVYT